MTHFGVQLHGTFPMARYPDLARAVERRPFTELTVHDVVWWRPVWPILTLAAAATERVLVGPDVTHPHLRHPVVTAANLAAIDELSGGRAILGVGRGSLLEPLGIGPGEGSVRRLVEEVHRHLGAAEGEGGFAWRPPRARIPVFVGAFGPRAVEAACAWADEIRPPGISDTGYFEHLRALVAGRARLGCEVWVAVDADRERARALGREILARFLPSMRAMTDFYAVDAGAAVSDRVLDLFVAAGTPADVAAVVERLAAAGADPITFSGRLGHDPLWAIDTLGAMIT